MAPEFDAVGAVPLVMALPKLSATRQSGFAALETITSTSLQSYLGGLTAARRAVAGSEGPRERMGVEGARMGGGSPLGPEVVSWGKLGDGDRNYIPQITLIPCVPPRGPILPIARSGN